MCIWLSASCLSLRGQFAPKKFINYNKSQIEKCKLVNNAILANGGDGNANLSHNHNNIFLPNQI